MSHAERVSQIEPISRTDAVSRTDSVRQPHKFGPKLELVDPGGEQTDRAGRTVESPPATWAPTWRPEPGEATRSEGRRLRLRLTLDPQRRRQLGQIISVLGVLLILAGLLSAFL